MLKKIGLFLCLLLLFSPNVWTKPTKAVIKKRRGGYRLYVNRRPFIVRGVCYNPVPVGKGPTFDYFSQPGFSPWMKDGPLMHDMGINVVRFYQVPLEHIEDVKKVIDYFYRKHKIYTIVGDWLGFWEYPGPLYGDKDFRSRVKQRVLKIVRALKDEPGVLAWMLGNENNYSFRGHIQPWTSPQIEKIKDPREKIDAKARVYYSFVEELSQEIKRIDRNHPVGLGNGELTNLEVASKICKDIDFLALVIYRGKKFGNIFKGARFAFDRPILFSEFGVDSFNAFSGKEDEDMQALFLKSQWKEIYKNIYPYGERNCLGGTIFEWQDEWWKHNPYSPHAWKVHSRGAGWSNGNYYFDIKAPRNLNMNEEWFGIVEVDAQNQRRPRRAFYELREFWKNPYRIIKKEKNSRKGRRR